MSLDGKKSKKNDQKNEYIRCKICKVTLNVPQALAYGVLGSNEKIKYYYSRRNRRS